jgi:hypothetical protein
VQIPPPTGSSQRATKPPVSGQAVTLKINSMTPSYGNDARRQTFANLLRLA